MKKIISVFLCVMLIVCAVAPITASAVTAQEIKDDLTKDPRPLKDYAYAFAVIGDTQIVTYDDAFNDKNNLNLLYDWVIANKEEKKIEFAIGLGDVTDTNMPVEWSHAYDQISKLDGVIPYPVVRGNHDLPLRYGVTDDTTDYFSLYLGTDAYKSQFKGCGGFYEKDAILNCWRTFSVGKVDYLFINFDFGPTDEHLQWAEKIIEEHPNHNVIISTHGYSDANFGRLGKQSDYSPSLYASTYNDGEDLWNKLVSKHENIVMVISGHISTSSVNVVQPVAENGNVVTEILVNPQGMDAQLKTSAVALLCFSEDGKNVQVEYYCATQDSYFKSAEQEFTVNVVDGTSTGPVGPTTPTVPETTAPEATTPEGTTPQGTTPEGTTPEGTTPQGTTPEGTTPEGTTPEGTTPEGTTPEGTTPEGTTPEGTTPEGSEPLETTEPEETEGAEETTEPEETKGEEETTEATEGKEDTDSSETGDPTNLWLWIALVAVSGGAIVALVVYNKKKTA